MLRQNKRGLRKSRAHTIPRGKFCLTGGVTFCVVAKRAAERRGKGEGRKVRPNIGTGQREAMWWRKGRRSTDKKGEALDTKLQAMLDTCTTQNFCPPGITGHGLCIGQKA